MVKADQIKGLEEINKRILNCKKCDFHNKLKELNNGHFFYKPDAPIPVYDYTSVLWKVVATGINPGWNKRYEEGEWKEAYKESDYEKYVKKVQELTKEELTKRNPYRDGIAKVFNLINKEVEIYEKKDIPSEQIWDYLFWANLSFCNSKKDSKREMGGEEISCRVYSEEIPNCLEEGYLKNIIEIIKPKLALFFTIKALDHIYYKLLLKKLFDIKNYDNILTNEEKEQKVTAYERSRDGKKVSVSVIPCKIKGEDIKILFLPHPNFQFNKEYKEEAIKNACEWLKRQ